jgi:NADH-ubiquinone oxidoreductase chain 6
MLYIVNETTFNGYSVYNLDMLHIIAILFGILVIISKNPIVSVLFLIGLFLSISGYLILTGLNFIGIAYLLVYIGAVSILFLFILMLINVRISELLIDSINSIPLAILLGSFFNYFVNNVLPNMVMINSLFYNFSIKKKLTNVTSVSWDGYLAETSHITSIGNILYGNYSIWLIITSVILLLAMVGCIVITLKEKHTHSMDPFKIRLLHSAVFTFNHTPSTVGGWGNFSTRYDSERLDEPNYLADILDELFDELLSLKDTSIQNYPELSRFNLGAVNWSSQSDRIKVLSWYNLYRMHEGKSSVTSISDTKIYREFIDYLKSL